MDMVEIGLLATLILLWLIIGRLNDISTSLKKDDELVKLDDILQALKEMKKDLNNNNEEIIQRIENFRKMSGHRTEREHEEYLSEIAHNYSEKNRNK